MSGTRKRFTAAYPCPICGGWEGMARGQGKRCHGYIVALDGKPYAICTREEFAAGVKYHEGSGGYIHHLDVAAPSPNVRVLHREDRRKPSRIVVCYDYHDEASTLLFQVCRTEPKNFPQRRPDGAGGWIDNLDGVRRVLYQLPELCAADPNAPVYVPEGEKHVDALMLLGLVATTNSEGAGKWRTEHSDALRGRHVVILPDNDKPGRDHARTVARAITGIAATVKIVTLPGLPPKGDVIDWLDNGGTVDQLVSLADATPLFDDPTCSSSPEDALSPRVSTLGEDEHLRGWTPKITRLSDVVSESVRWLWPGYLPSGKLIVMDGDPGLGKSTLTLDLAARVSRGDLMPDGTHGDLDRPAGVVILSAEDGLSDTIRPRLDAAGADVHRIVALESVSRGDEERGVTIADIAHIERAIATVDAKLVILDPLMSFLDDGVNANGDHQIRRSLAPFARLAERTGASLLVIRHFNKSTGGNVLYRGGASIGIIGAARLGLVVAADPDDETGVRRVLAVSKSNLGPIPTALAFRLVQGSGDVAHVAWDGPTHHTATTLLVTPLDGEGWGAKTAAKDFLRNVLADGPQPANMVSAKAKSEGISKITLRRAQEALGIVPRKVGFVGGWMWELPEEDATSATPKMLTVSPRCSPQNDEHLGQDMSKLADDEDESVDWVQGAFAAEDVADD